MNVEVKGVHFDIPPQLRAYIDKKLTRLKHAQEHIVDLRVTITEAAKGPSSFEGHAHFRWGAIAHVSVQAFANQEGIDLLFDKLEPKVDKEKQRITEHKGGGPE